MAANPTRNKTTVAGKSIRPALKAAKSEPATGLDKLIHERTRLALVSALAANSTMTFNELKAVLQITDGNLSVHARKLEDAGYVVCTKEFSGRTPRTSYKLTPAGRKAFDRYLAHLDALVSAMKQR